MMDETMNENPVRLRWINNNIAVITVTITRAKAVLVSVLWGERRIRVLGRRCRIDVHEPIGIGIHIIELRT